MLRRHRYVHDVETPAAVPDDAAHADGGVCRGVHDVAAEPAAGDGEGGLLSRLGR